VDDAAFDGWVFPPGLSGLDSGPEGGSPGGSVSEGRPVSEGAPVSGDGPPGGRRLVIGPDDLRRVLEYLLRAGPATSADRDPREDPRADHGGVPSLGRPEAEAVRRAELLGAVGRRFVTPDDPLREEALRRLPGSAGIGREMAREILDGMAADWTSERLRRLLVEDLGDPRVLDGFVPRRGRSVLAVPPRVCSHIVSGSVPGVGVSALLRSLLVGAPTFLKPGAGDALLPVLFARALRDSAPRLARRLAVVYWPGGRTDLEAVLLAGSEVVTVYGGDDTVASLRARAPAGTGVVGYGHRDGIGLVGTGALRSPASTERAARAVARAAAMFDQRGCVSTRVVYVERASGGDPRTAAPGAFFERLAAALDDLDRTLPAGDLSVAEMSRVQQLRGTAEMLASGYREDEPDAVRLSHGGPTPWTVIYDPTWAMEADAPGRTLLVRPFDRLEEVLGRLAGRPHHLQTVGVTGLGDRLEVVAESFARLGVSRVTPFETVPFPVAWWHHDGRGPLVDLVRWVDLERDGLEADGD